VDAQSRPHGISGRPLQLSHRPAAGTTALGLGSGFHHYLEHFSSFLFGPPFKAAEPVDFPQMEGYSRGIFLAIQMEMRKRVPRNADAPWQSPGSVRVALILPTFLTISIFPRHSFVRAAAKLAKNRGLSSVVAKLDPRDLVNDNRIRALGFNQRDYSLSGSAYLEECSFDPLVPSIEDYMF